MYSGLSSGFSIEEEENDVEDQEKDKTETNLHKKYTSPLDKIKELENKINSAKVLSELKAINEKYQHEIVSLALTNLVEQKRKELWQLWFKNFETDVNKCQSEKSLDMIREKYKYLITSKDYSHSCANLLTIKTSKVA